MKGERSKAVRAVRNSYEKVDEEDSEISYSVAYQNVEPSEVSAGITYQRLKDNLGDNSIKSVKQENQVKKGRPYKVCGGKTKDRKGIVATSFKIIVAEDESLCQGCWLLGRLYHHKTRRKSCGDM